jgi:3-oxoacyl-[acyl-carrier protein] reductase
MFDLTGKIAIVTGASRGIGRGIASRLAAQGALVIAVARADNAASTVAEIAAAGGKAEAASADVTDTAAVQALVDGVLERHRRIDILVNNAGITKDQLLLRLKREDWDAVIATNLTAAFTCSQTVLRPMIKQRSGRIIMISSVVGQSGNAGQANYAASKAGLIGFAKSLAREVGSRNITVNTIAPGLIETEMTKTIADKAQEQWAASIPLGRTGIVADVAAAVCFLASDEAGYITGQVLAVNGGMYM